MPEETNRVLTDHCSEILFTPSKLAGQNLKKEGFKNNCIIEVGDIMYDVFLSVFNKLKKKNNNYDIIVTIHRAENTNFKIKMLNIIKNLNRLSYEYSILFPMHPRTKKLLIQYKIFRLLSKRIKVTKPMSYKASINCLKYSKLLITDSGGMQKEAFYAKIQSLTLRDETEWPETINAKWNRLIKPTGNHIYNSVNKSIKTIGKNINLYGSGNTSKLILKKIKKLL